MRVSPRSAVSLRVLCPLWREHPFARASASAAAAAPHHRLEGAASPASPPHINVRGTRDQVHGGCVSHKCVFEQSDLTGTASSNGMPSDFLQRHNT